MSNYSIAFVRKRAALNKYPSQIKNDEQDGTGTSFSSHKKNDDRKENNNRFIKKFSKQTKKEMKKKNKLASKLTSSADPSKRKVHFDSDDTSTTESIDDDIVILNDQNRPFNIVPRVNVQTARSIRNIPPNIPDSNDSASVYTPPTFDDTIAGSGTVFGKFNKNKDKAKPGRKPIFPLSEDLWSRQESQSSVEPNSSVKSYASSSSIMDKFRPDSKSSEWDIFDNYGNRINFGQGGVFGKISGNKGMAKPGKKAEFSSDDEDLISYAEDPSFSFEVDSDVVPRKPLHQSPRSSSNPTKSSSNPWDVTPISSSPEQNIKPSEKYIKPTIIYRNNNASTTTSTVTSSSPRRDYLRYPTVTPRNDMDAFFDKLSRLQNTGKI